MVMFFTLLNLLLHKLHLVLSSATVVAITLSKLLPLMASEVVPGSCSPRSEGVGEEACGGAHPQSKCLLALLLGPGLADPVCSHLPPGLGLSCA